MGHTVIGLFGVRAGPGSSISMRVTEEDLKALRSGIRWTNAPAWERPSFERRDPSSGYWKARQFIIRESRTLAP